MQAFIDSYPNSSGPAQFAPAFPNYIEDVVLSASALLSLPLPSGARFAIFSFDTDIRVRIGSASDSIQWPSATSLSGGGSEFNPSARRIPVPTDGLPAPTHLHLLSQSRCTGSVSYYA